MEPASVLFQVTTRDLAAVDLPKGGVWKVCYCANYDIDADDVICAVTSEYTTEAGLLTVHGAAGDETFYCPKDGQCLITITGTALTTDDRVQVIDFGGTCGTALMSRRAPELAVIIQLVQVAIRAPPGCASFGCTSVLQYF